MSRLIPLNSRARDDCFDAQLTSLLDGDVSVLSEMDPELADIAYDMTRLAREARWLDEDPGESPTRIARAAQRVSPIASRLVAALIIGLVSVIILLGYRLLHTTTEPEFAAQQQSETLVLRAGVCNRPAVSRAKLEDNLVTDFQSLRTGATTTISAVQNELIQLTRDWNNCQLRGMYEQALSYESAYFQQNLSMSNYTPTDQSPVPYEIIVANLDPSFTGQGVDNTLANQRLIAPLSNGADEQLVLYSLEWTEADPDTHEISRATMWVVPVNEHADWTRWPTVIQYIHEPDGWKIEGMYTAPQANGTVAAMDPRAAIPPTLIPTASPPAGN